MEVECTVDTNLEQGEEQGTAWLREQIAELLHPGEEFRLEIDALPTDYLTGFTPENVVHHLRLHRDQATLLQQKVLLFPEKRHGSWSLLMLCR
ncbi:MAG: hypothetical protein D3924_05920, partial [Candidatus Electrothrix sp. AR4]|nr:hypothetical protein [Candidatus Electrothrix sp. AR4]